MSGGEKMSVDVSKMPKLGFGLMRLPEKEVVEGAPFELSTEKEDALHEIFFLTHIAFGISYYKAFCRR